MHFSGNKIRQIEANAFQDLSELRIVDLSNNELETLPKTLFEKQW